MKNVFSITLLVASAAFAGTVAERPKGCPVPSARQQRQLTTMHWARSVLDRVWASWQAEVRKPGFTGADAHQRHTPLSLAEFARQAEALESSEARSKKL